MDAWALVVIPVAVVWMLGPHPFGVRLGRDPL